MIKLSGHLFCGKESLSSSKTLLSPKQPNFCSLFILSEFLFISACLIALPKSKGRLLLLFYAVALGAFQMEQLCEINVLFWAVFIQAMPISSVMPWLCRRLQGGGEAGCRVSQLCFVVMILLSLTLPLLACLPLIAKGLELTCSRAWKFWK